MQDFRFRDTLKMTSSQRKEVQSYLNSLTVFTEETILKLVRKIKELERKIDEQKYQS